MIDRLAAVLPGLAREQARVNCLLRAGEELSIGDLVGKAGLWRFNMPPALTAHWHGRCRRMIRTSSRCSTATTTRIIGVEAGEVACDMLAAIARAEEDSPDLPQTSTISTMPKGFSGALGHGMVRAAHARDIPVYRLNDASLIQVGQGKYQQRIEAALTSKTSHIAVEIASDKSLANSILADLGLPVPKQRLVYSVDEGDGGGRTNRLSRGHQAARRQSRPGSYRQHHLRGRHRRRLRDRRCRRIGRVVETMLRGDDHRLLVVNGQLAAAARRVPGHVKGDGRHTIAELVDVVNQTRAAASGMKTC